MELLLIITVVIALYWRTNNYLFLIDDPVRRWGYLLEIPETSPNQEFYASKPSKFRHLFLTLTHAVIVSIIYFLWGWKAALLFAVNPICVACSAWITGGYYQVTALFTLVAYFFLIKIPTIYGALIAALFFTGALGSTINCIAIPFIFLVHPPLNGLILFWPLIMYLTGRRFNIGFRKRNSGKGDKITWRKVAVVPKVLAYYIKTTIFPKRLAFFQEFGFEYGKNPKVQKDLETFNKHFWKSAAISIAFIGTGFLLSPLGILIYLAGILPFTQWKVLGQFVCERYLYIPMIGWTLMLAGGLAHPIATPLVLIISVLYAYRANKYIPAFKNIENLYQNGIENFPKCISNYVNLAERKLHTGKYYEAYKLLKQGIEIDPNSFLCHANLAAYWLAINRPDKGKYHTEMAMRFSEHRGMAYNIFKQQMNHIGKGLALQKEMEKKTAEFLEEIRAKEKKVSPALCGML